MKMLDKVATHFEAEVDNAVDGLTSLMEPLIMAVLGVLVGGLMVAMYFADLHAWLRNVS